MDKQLTEEVIRKVKGGDVDAFRIIVQMFEVKVRIYLGAHLRNTHDVDDLTQDSFIAAYEGLERFRSGSDFEPWLLSITRNKLMSRLRRDYRAEERREDLKGQVFAELSDKLISRVRRLVGERARDVLEARYFREEKVQDIAENMGANPNSISAVLLRGRKQLRTCMERQECL